MAQGVKANGEKKIYRERPSRICAAPDCDREFQPKPIGRPADFCSAACQTRTFRRRAPGLHIPVSAAEKYAEGPRPLCACHGKKMVWHKNGRFVAGGNWGCVADHSLKRRIRRQTMTKEQRYRERRRDGLRKYGLSLAEYDALLAQQGGRCALCPATEANSHSHVLHVDHDHETGRIRGLLCNVCNMAVSRIDAVPGWTDAAKLYAARD